MRIEMNHRTTWVKVNALVDEGIAELVRLLNDFPHVQTIESCEGGSSNPAWVAFWYGEYWKDPWKGLCEFVFSHLGPHLATALRGNITLQVVITENGGVQGELTVMPGAMAPTIKALRQLLQSGD